MVYGVLGHGEVLEIRVWCHGLFWGSLQIITDYRLWAMSLRRSLRAMIQTLW